MNEFSGKLRFQHSCNLSYFAAYMNGRLFMRLYIIQIVSLFWDVGLLTIFAKTNSTMIVITGAAGFIGSCLVSKFNQEGREDLVLVDDFSKTEKSANLAGKHFAVQVDRNRFDAWMQRNGEQVTFVYHIGARTDTTEFDKAIFDELNVDYSKMVWNHCVRFGIPLVYASSGATYGLGEIGYDDNEATIPQLQPLNPYGWSKQWFDMWALEQTEKPPFWAGLKFFNVYGPNEYHKGIHNSTLAIAIATTVLLNSAIAMPAAIYSIFMFTTAAMFGYLVARRGQE